jgi:ribosomal protein L37AE/L43A
VATANCPSCGAPVRFRGAQSIVAVCEFCLSTLVRQGTALEDIGKMAAVIEDASPVQLGTEGRYKGVHFAAIGRIQYRYAAGAWNEWYCLFDDQRGGWLSDAMGNYVMTFLVRSGGLPPLEKVQVGRQAKLDGRAYDIVNIERGHVIAGQGELPFKVGAGWEGVFVDLRGEDDRFATLDYSDDPPLLFAGEQAPFEAFAFQNLRDPGAGGKPTGTASSFACPGCGAPLTRRVKTTEAVACGSCGAVIDVANPGLQIVSRVAEHAAQVKLPIPLGSRGKLADAEYEAVGFMRREMSVEGVRYVVTVRDKDDPEKVLRPPEDTSLHLLPQLWEALGQPLNELVLVSPYFVPGRGGTDTLLAIARECRWNGFYPRSELFPGVVHAATAPHGRTDIVSKPGGFGGNDALVKIWKAIAASGRSGADPR